jgi:hypothetical protein
MKQWQRLAGIVLVAEVAALDISIGIVADSIPAVFVGVNLAFIAAGMIVLDHEARGRERS